MTTLGEVLDDLEERMFAGRESELSVFREWLASAGQVPQVLDVHGPGGIGKSALLRAFRRIAIRADYPVLLVDCRSLAPSPDAMLQALGAAELDDVVRRLDELGPVLLFDALDHCRELAQYLLDVLLPRLDATVKVVVAGRLPLPSVVRAGPWTPLVRPLRLDNLSVEDSSAYLARRDVREPRLVHQVWTATQGYPLGLSLAADAVLHLGVRDFTAAAERHLIVRSLVDTLLHEVSDPVVRDLLEVCAVMREVDETALAALSGRPDVGDAFEKLCLLSIVRPSRHGLTLPRQIRGLLGEDLRWRRPDRYRQLCRRAADFYRERIRDAGPQDREWLMTERLRLLDQARTDAPVFYPGAGEGVWLETGREADHRAFLALPSGWQSRYGDRVAPSAQGSTSNGARLDASQSNGFQYDGFQSNGFPSNSSRVSASRPHEPDRRERWLSFKERRLRVARDESGRLVAGSLAVPLCRPTVPTLLADPELGPALSRHWSSHRLPELPECGTDATDFWIVDLPALDPTGIAARVVWRDLLTLFARGGVYFATTTAGDTVTERRLHDVGFRRIAESESSERGTVVHAHVLDVGQIGLTAWLDLVLSPRRPSVPVTPEELQAELRAVLPQWGNDAGLARSSLAALAGAPPDATEGQAAEAVRRLIESALAEARATRHENVMAYQALEMAFVNRIGSHERVAERLAVSRSTLYRLLRRGEEDLSWLILGRGSLERGESSRLVQEP